MASVDIVVLKGEIIGLKNNNEKYWGKKKWYVSKYEILPDHSKAPIKVCGCVLFEIRAPRQCFIPKDPKSESLQSPPTTSSQVKKHPSLRWPYTFVAHDLCLTRVFILAKLLPQCSPLCHKHDFSFFLSSILFQQDTWAVLMSLGAMGASWRSGGSVSGSSLEAYHY